MPRNSTMKDKLSTALKREPGGLKAVKPLPKEQQERAKRVRKSFRLYSQHTNQEQPEQPETSVAVEEVPITESSTELSESPSPTEAELQSTLESIKSSSEVVAESAQVDLPPHSSESSQSPKIDSQEPDELRPSITSDLEWLNRPTPFSPNLTVMVNSLKAAKTRLAFTFEQARAREKVKRQTLERAQFDLAQEETLIARLRDELSKVDDTMAGCALVAEQSAQIANLIVQPSGKTPRVIGEPGTFIKRDRDDPSFCGSADVLGFFQQNPIGTWNAKNVVRGLPAVKQDRARKAMPAILASLASQGKLMRVAEGQYKLVS